LVLTKRFLGIEVIISTRTQLIDVLLELLVVSMNSMEAEVLVLMQAVLLMHKALKGIRRIHEAVEAGVIEWHLAQIVEVVEAWIKGRTWMQGYPRYRLLLILLLAVNFWTC